MGLEAREERGAQLCHEFHLLINPVCISERLATVLKFKLILWQKEGSINVRGVSAFAAHRPVAELLLRLLSRLSDHRGQGLLIEPDLPEPIGIENLVLDEENVFMILIAEQLLLSHQVACPLVEAQHAQVGSAAKDRVVAQQLCAAGRDLL